MWIFYSIGVLVAVPILVLIFRFDRDETEPPTAGWLVVLLSFLWPVMLPITAFYYVSKFIGRLVNVAKAEESPATTAVPACSRCRSPLRRTAQYCSHCGQKWDR